MAVARQDRWQIVLAGMGGQGLVFLGNVLGQAAVLHADLYAAVTQSYGIASRGGFTKSEVVLGPRPIAYPRVQTPDCVLALTQQALDMYRGRAGAGSWVVYDGDTASSVPGQGVVGLPLTSTAAARGLSRSVNVMALGAMVEMLDLLPRDAVEGALGSAAGRFGQANLDAFRTGCELGRDWSESGR